VFILSFSVRIGAGLTMLVLSLGLIMHYSSQQISETPELMLHFLPFVGF
jgi:flagellar biosynthesis protein FliR